MATRLQSVRDKFFRGRVFCIDDVSKECYVSAMTARRYIKQLHEQGEIYIKRYETRAGTPKPFYKFRLLYQIGILRDAPKPNSIKSASQTN